MSEQAPFYPPYRAIDPSRRVLITGLGLVTPLGTGKEVNWQGLCAGQSGIRTISRFDASDLDTRIAGEVPDFDPLRYLGIKEARRMDRFMQLAVVAAHLAMEDGSLKISPELAPRVGVVVGSGLGGLESLEKACHTLRDRGARRLSPFFVPMTLINLAPGQVGMHVGAKGPCFSTVTACATGAHCIGDAMRLIHRGEADMVLAGGTEATITPLGIGGFGAMQALSRRNDDPPRASRPFDLDRDGFVVGEGAGVLLLEAAQVAQARGARPYAELAGYGSTGDAYHITQPSPDGDGAARAMDLAIRDGGLTPEDIDYINAHGTSTPLNDLVETRAIRKVFGDRAVPISSTKSMMGHLLGAAGAVEAAVCALAIHHGLVPPTINMEHMDPECALAHVTGQARPLRVKIALNNSFGFGGTNAALVLREPR